ncbi:MAG TPA: hypothetical protein PKD20_05630 [Candidatus Saccharibacteria bacterium]|jgi:hypothetical protein|nr:hypothetical protein [Candidatus Saccharibacteria bacterium]HMT56322.1 hypothetical protein [Candidatus Saccharibacteria bacterium]
MTESNDMKLIRALKSNSGSSVLLAIIVGFTSLEYLDKILRSTIEIVFKNDGFSYAAEYPKDSVIWPILSLLISILVIYVVMLLSTFIGKIFKSTSKSLHSISGISITIAIVVGLYLKVQLMTLANYLGRVLIGLNEGGGSHNMSFMDNVVYTSLSALVMVLLFELVSRIIDKVDTK